MSGGPIFDQLIGCGPFCPGILASNIPSARRRLGGGPGTVGVQRRGNCFHQGAAAHPETHDPGWI